MKKALIITAIIIALLFVIYFISKEVKNRKETTVESPVVNEEATSETSTGLEFETVDNSSILTKPLETKIIIEE